MFKNRPTSGWVYLPLCLTLVIFGLWRLSQLPFLAWLGIVTAMMGMALPIVALVLSLNQNEKQTSRGRLQALALTSVLTGLSVVICWNSYASFSKSNPHTLKTVKIRNTTAQMIPEMTLRYGSAEMKVEKIAARQTKSIELQIFSETAVRASMKAPDGTERYTQFMVGPENNRIQIMIDWNQNLMADVM